MRIPATVAIFGAILFFSGCGNSTTKEEVPLDEIKLELDFERMDNLFRKAGKELEKDSTKEVPDYMGVYNRLLKPKKEFILEWLYGQDSTLSDTIIALDIARFLHSKSVMALFDTVATHFPDDQKLKEKFINPFKRYHHYFPEKEIPKIRTYVTGYPMGDTPVLDNVQITENYLGVGLHYFLGANYPYPGETPRYIRNRLDERHMMVVIFAEIFEKIAARPQVQKQPVLVEEMVRAGIKLQFLHKILPDVPDSLVIFYDSEQMSWANAREKEIYKQILPDLYSTDVNMYRDLIDENAFTKMFGRESPPRLGHFLGWKIVQAFMAKHSEVTLAQLVARNDYDKIFQESGYKAE